MASKKPAKVNAGTVREKVKELPGKAIKYFSPVRGQNPFICPSCNRTLYKGIVFDYNTIMYCSRKCIPKDVI